METFSFFVSRLIFSIVILRPSLPLPPFQPPAPATPRSSDLAMARQRNIAQQIQAN